MRIDDSQGTTVKYIVRVIALKSFCRIYLNQVRIYYFYIKYL
ncbi:hypothetical protein HMPREF9220_1300 [Dialister micraerophilus UPII 345-E]|uniref:Uncharacterized protein n=1 Tax=Dialister micraerophilus UPII 345-E TaxID=910314 RepID=E4L7F1_9FIRM|nr:hypothetical protein HMPREF9220_1300 [Dialister micraerophilus UPII 345-E]